MRRRLGLVLSLGVLVGIIGCATVPLPPPAPLGPSLLPVEGSIPGVPPEVGTAEFWIARAANPDTLIMTREEIRRFNDANPMKSGYMLDITAMSDSIDGGSLRGYLARTIGDLFSRRLLVTGDIPLEAAERRSIAALIDTTGVPKTIGLRFGLVLQSTMGRAWPSDILLMSDPGDAEFDQGVVAALDTGTPVALLHASADGLWSFVQTPWFLCWVRSEAVAFGTRSMVKEFLHPDPPVVVLTHRISIYGDPGLKSAVSSLSLGGALPLKIAGRDFYGVVVPGRGPDGALILNQGYIRTGPEVSIGYPAYTLRNVYRIAFSLMGRRYGWGGMYGERDCSAFIMDIFRCFDIHLPRNSASQPKAAQAILAMEGMDRTTRLAVVNALPGGISLLQMSGHIMLHLGAVDGVPYAIHDFWAWRTAEDGRQIAHRAARVAVTGLSLGEGSERGAFIDRLANVAILGNYRFNENP